MITQPVHVSANRRFLVQEDGVPFFWLGDTAWELFHRCDRAEAELYLENRRQKGFTVIQAVALAEFDGLRTPNAYGDLPLWDEDPTRPNEAYFAHVDFIIRRAAEKDLYIGLLPTWGDKVIPIWGKGPAIFNARNARVYGRWLGERYRDQPNIIWILGGDRPPFYRDRDFAPIWRALAAGIREGVNGHTLMTYHPVGGTGSSVMHDDDWLDLNMWQSGHADPDTANWAMIARDYARTPIKPVLDGEPCYEDHPVNPYTRQWKPEYGYFDDYPVRKRAYWAVLAGACGHTYGNHSIWQMYDERREPVTFPRITWREALDRPGAAHMIHLRRLVLSRPYLTRIPDPGLLASGAGEGGQHVQAARDADGSYALIYIPNAGQTVEVDTAALTGERLNVTWYDPRTGEATAAGDIARGGVCAFTTPASGPDWVLALDDAACNFGPPGQG